MWSKCQNMGFPAKNGENGKIWEFGALMAVEAPACKGIYFTPWQATKNPVKPEALQGDGVCLTDGHLNL